jgi:hypothetical protein
MYHYMMSIRLASSETKPSARDSEDTDSADSKHKRRHFQTRSKVFLFATKAVREALSMNSMTTAMEYLEVSSVVAVSPEENEKLLQLTDEAIGELHALSTEDLGDALPFSSWEVGDAELFDFREKICSKLSTQTEEGEEREERGERGALSDSKG